MWNTFLVSENIRLRRFHSCIRIWTHRNISRGRNHELKIETDLYNTIFCITDNSSTCFTILPYTLEFRRVSAHYSLPSVA